MVPKVLASLSIELECIDGRWLAVAPWGQGEGRTWEEAYTAVMRLRTKVTP